VETSTATCATMATAVLLSPPACRMTSEQTPIGSPTKVGARLIADVVPSGSVIDSCIWSGHAWSRGALWRQQRRQRWQREQHSTSARLPSSYLTLYVPSLLHVMMVAG
jgi:hypothetical protein